MGCCGSKSKEPEEDTEDEYKLSQIGPTAQQLKSHRTRNAYTTLKKIRKST